MILILEQMARGRPAGIADAPCRLRGPQFAGPRARGTTPLAEPAELLYFGRLEYEKGVHDAIAALPRIRRTHPGTTLTIAGDGTQLDFLVEQARRHKVLKAVNFVGRVDHSQLLEHLHRCDAAVLPSHYEPFGIVALEAAATGAPLVTSTVGGLGGCPFAGQKGAAGNICTEELVLLCQEMGIETGVDLEAHARPAGQ